MSFFNKMVIGIRNHWKKVTIPTKDKPEGTITFDESGNIVEIENVKIINRPKVTPPVDTNKDGTVENINEYIIKPIKNEIGKIKDEIDKAITPPKDLPKGTTVTFEESGAITPTEEANTVTIQSTANTINTANNSISNLVKNIMESFKT